MFAEANHNWTLLATFYLMKEHKTVRKPQVLQQTIIYCNCKWHLLTTNYKNQPKIWTATQANFYLLRRASAKAFLSLWAKKRLFLLFWPILCVYTLVTLVTFSSNL